MSMKPIETTDEWQKVRRLADRWNRQMHWQLSNRGLVVIALLLFTAGFIIPNLSVIFLLFTVFTVMKLYARHERIEGYVDGWQQGQDYVSGNFTLKDLIEHDKPTKQPVKRLAKTVVKQSPASDKSNYRK